MSKFYRYFFLGRLGLLAEKSLRQLQLIETDAVKMLSDLAVMNGAKAENISSQLGQDLFVLSVLLWKRNGYFVEFGAADGRFLSNTFLLEEDFGWNGILAEPAEVWHNRLLKNRNVSIDTECVWSRTGAEIDFWVSMEAEYSTARSYLKNRSFLRNKKNEKWCKVKTISLNDLLIRHNAPRKIDYLSLDTEGSEYEILSSFDFNAYDVSIITCEHNFSENREKVKELLEGFGFIRVYVGLSRWDDWFVHPGHASWGGAPK